MFYQKKNIPEKSSNEHEKAQVYNKVKAKSCIETCTTVVKPRQTQPRKEIFLYHLAAELRENIEKVPSTVNDLKYRNF